MNDQRSLAHMPVTLFASVMGLGALALAWRRADVIWGIGEWPYLALLAIASAVYVFVLAAYILKWIRFPKAALAELGHPMRIPFVPTITIATLVLATGLAPVAPTVATVMWWIGAIGHLLATIAVLTIWFKRPDIGIDKVTPAWLIPIVGNVVTPLSAGSIANMDVAWFSFGVGLVFWLGILPIILHRLLLVEAPIPPKLLPTLAVMVAPPAISMISWHQLTGDTTGPVIRNLYATAWVMALLVAAQLATFRKLPFALPFLAFTFPAGALAVASEIVAGAMGGFYHVIAVFALAVATVLILAIVAGVAALVVRGKVFLPE